MAKLERTISFQIGNPTKRRAKVTVAISRAKRAAIAADPLLRQIEAPPLVLRAFGLLPHDCGLLLGDRPPPIRRSLTMELEAGETAELLVAVQIQGPLPRKQAVQVLEIAQRIDRKPVSAITVVVAAYPDQLSFSAIAEPNPTPLVLDGPMVATAGQAAGDPSETQNIEAFTTITSLGVMVRNRGNSPLVNVEFYLESTTAGLLKIDPLVFQIAKLEPGGRFFAAVPADVSSVPEGRFRVTFCGTADGYGPVRLRAEIDRWRIARGGGDDRVPRP